MLEVLRVEADRPEQDGRLRGNGAWLDATTPNRSEEGSTAKARVPLSAARSPGVQPGVDASAVMAASTTRAQGRHSGGWASAGRRRGRAVASSPPLPQPAERHEPPAGHSSGAWCGARSRRRLVRLETQVRRARTPGGACTATPRGVAWYAGRPHTPRPLVRRGQEHGQGPLFTPVAACAPRARRVWSRESDTRHKQETPVAACAPRARRVWSRGTTHATNKQKTPVAACAPRARCVWSRARKQHTPQTNKKRPLRRALLERGVCGRARENNTRHKQTKSARCGVRS